jgi:hypothetical protein
MTAMFDRKGFIDSVVDEVVREYKEVSTHGFDNAKALLIHVLNNLDGYAPDQTISSRKEAKKYLGELFDKFEVEAGEELDDLDNGVIAFQDALGEYLNYMANSVGESNKHFAIDVHFIERHYRGDDRFECCVETVTKGGQHEFYFTYPLGATWEEALADYPTFTSIIEKLSSLPEFACAASDIQVLEVTGEQGLYEV